MSRTCRIRLASVPTPAELQSGLKVLGYKLNLEGLDLASASGFQGCVLDGEDAGFSVTQEGDGLSLRWTGDPREHCAALMVASALQKLSEAEICLGSGAPLSAATLHSRVLELLDEM
ncbi:hypothetical protein [Uliginosibacterium sp. TH139]|uniref:hypothetical protein n=1 Tax=Uliginosibacterium sp. TH139 TaxID=2067453 RepID=UPI000C7AE79C|nr:hypothetical protein [Uliginosibacterium sp. TH139]PLK47785.1 hypothetical protein C0V76_15570 [Uliginosibacterium sp. TH139]